ncbi:urease accessory protein UreF [Roseococcus sp. YIM B11640]|uniref:urease accessory protein UreF n=1 Tax=Roseococcus sp. YIM B11640 TaxID=3133973 RepID=UPI003C7C4768
MTDADLFRLIAWTSPAYPVGGFSYSHGIEMAVEEGRLPDRVALVSYIEAVLRRGAGHVDAVLLAAAHRAPDDAALDEVAELAAAWRGTAETALEATQQGGSFASVTATAWPHERYAAFAKRHRGRLAHAVAFGAAAGMAGMPLRPSLLAYLQGFAANLVSAGIRLVPLGQTDGQLATAALLPVVAECATLAETASVEEIGTATPLLDMLSMRHETQYTRLFRS